MYRKGWMRVMAIEFTEEKCFSQEDVESLYLSVGWISGQYPARLYRALQNSSTVLMAWDGTKLVGLLRALDDGGMLAYIHYVLVRPDYQGHGLTAPPGKPGGFHWCCICIWHRFLEG